MKKHRLIIYPKDIQLITGKCERSAQLFLNHIKSKLGKNKNQFLSIKEFCQFTGLNDEDVLKLIVD